MKIGVVVPGQMDTTVISGKVLASVDGRSSLGHTLDCVSVAAPFTHKVVITGLGSDSDKVATFCDHSFTSCFRTHLNEPRALLDCADHYDWKYVVWLNPNGVLFDRDTLGRMIAVAELDSFDVISSINAGFASGMEIEIIKTSILRQALIENPHFEKYLNVHVFLFGDDRFKKYRYRSPLKISQYINMELISNETAESIRHLVSSLGPNRANFTLSELCKAADRTYSANSWKRENNRPMLIAEIGGNHEGSMVSARNLAELAIAGGADCIKFQLYRGDTLVSPVEAPDRHKHFQIFELQIQQHIELAELCRRSGVTYLASVWDLEMLDALEPYLDFYKIGSGDLTAWPILTAFAKRGKPIILSTGLANEDEILATVAQLVNIDEGYRRPENLCLMQCTSMYPIPDSDAHLRVMDRLRSVTGLAVGYSDHTIGSQALRTAAAMGAEVLEFHFTDVRDGKTFRDHQVSLTADEVLSLRTDLQKIVELRGDCCKEIRPSEAKNGHLISFRRAVYVNRFVPAGDVIKLTDLELLRPNVGTDARYMDRVIGAKALRDIEPFRAILPGLDFS